MHRKNEIASKKYGSTRCIDHAIDAAAIHRLQDEIGDVLFVCANLARHAKVDTGAALRHANLKFERRFRMMETLAQQDGVALSTLPLEAQDEYWNRSKRIERGEAE